MAHHDYLIRYSNGFKRHVSKADIDLLGADARKVGPREYFCNVSIQKEQEITSGPNYLDLELVFEYPPDREYEREQTPRGMIARLEEMGFQRLERAGQLQEAG
jgi:hypothetical protein